MKKTQGFGNGSAWRKGQRTEIIYLFFIFIIIIIFFFCFIFGLGSRVLSMGQQYSGDIVLQCLIFRTPLINAQCPSMLIKILALIWNASQCRSLPINADQMGIYRHWDRHWSRESCVLVGHHVTVFPIF